MVFCCGLYILNGFPQRRGLATQWKLRKIKCGLSRGSKICPA